MSTTGASLVAPPTSGDKLSDNDHGNRFQSKMLFLSFLRAINEGSNFHLGTELAKFGGKFDDLIFLKDYGQPNGQKSFLYLQAKHRLHEKPNKKAKSITLEYLLNDNKGDFSLMKYFHSYRDDIMKAKEGPQPTDKVDCVICTNIDFDKEDLVGKKIQIRHVEKLSDMMGELLTFKPVQPSSQTREINKARRIGLQVMKTLTESTTKWQTF